MYKVALCFTLLFAIAFAYEALSGTYADSLASKVHNMSMNNPLLMGMLVQMTAMSLWICFWDNFFGEDAPTPNAHSHSHNSLLDSGRQNELTEPPYFSNILPILKKSLIFMKQETMVSCPCRINFIFLSPSDFK